MSTSGATCRNCGNSGRDMFGGICPCQRKRMGLAAWPAPCLQPDPNEDCSFYSVAYLCRCLGRPEVTGEQVKAWRAHAGFRELHYPEPFAAETLHFFRHMREPEWWLGPSARAWVAGKLRAGYLGLAVVWRTTEMAHSVAVLDDRGDAGVLLMDPGRGLVVEPWHWFLARGPETARGQIVQHPAQPFEVHMIDAWYLRPGAGSHA